MNAIAVDAPVVLRHDDPPMPAIERRGAPRADVFRREYLLPRRPVVFDDLADEWLARHEYTPDRFRRDYGSMRVLPVDGRAPTIREVLDAVEANDPSNRAPYPARIDLDRMAPELRDEFQPRYAGSLPDRLADPLLPTRLFEGYSNYEMFFGGPDARFPYLHYDYFHVHTWVTQLYGRKTFVLYPPGDAAVLYPRDDEPWQSRIVDIEAVDLERFPRFVEARPQRITLERGDTLFMPTGWWHTTRADEPNISVAFGQLGPDNWDEFVADVVSIATRKQRHALAWAAKTYLRGVDAVARLREQGAAAR